jgi:tRNA A-37 threonylcarbamoyl transferase component Bud32
MVTEQETTSSGLPGVPGYTLLEELGRGGMGVVYKARQSRLNRLVALKMIQAGRAGAADVARFRTEAEAIARLQHPHVVQIHEVGEVEGRPFFSLEYVCGGSLANRLDGTPLPGLEAARLVETLARAIETAHQAGIIHRDLKPANVLLSADGQPKITDFGVAKKLDDAAGPTASGVIVGTPSYMAPEQAGGKIREIGPATDVYALGAILYELLTGRPPFKAATPLDTVLQVVNDEPVAPRQLQPKTPRDLETICLKCLHKEPAGRYRTAAALAEDLRRFAEGQPIVARTIGAWGRGWRWCRRNPVVAGLGTGVSLLLLLVAVAGPLVAWHQASLREAAQLKEGEARKAQQGAEAAQDQARRQTLEAYENLAQARLSQAKTLWTSNQARRQSLALDYLREVIGLRTPMNRMVEEMGESVGDWAQRNERFWADQLPQLSTEALRWLSTSSLTPVGRPLQISPGDPQMHSGVIRGAAIAVSEDGRWLACCQTAADRNAVHRIVLWDLQARIVRRTMDLRVDSAAAGAPPISPSIDSLALAFSRDGEQLVAAWRQFPVSFRGNSAPSFFLESFALRSQDPGRRLSLAVVAQGPQDGTRPVSLFPLPDQQLTVVFPVFRQPSSGPNPAVPCAVTCDNRDGRQLAAIAIPQGFSAVGLRPSGRELVCLGTKMSRQGTFPFSRQVSLQLVDIESGKVVKAVSWDQSEDSSSDRIHDHLRPALSTNEQWLVELREENNYTEVLIRDAATNAVKAITPLPESPSLSYEFSRTSRSSFLCAFNPDSRALALLTMERLYLLSIPDGILLESKVHPDRDVPERGMQSSSRAKWSPIYLAFAGNGAQLVTALQSWGAEGSAPRQPGTATGAELVQIWDVITARLDAPQEFVSRGPLFAVDSDARGDRLFFANGGNQYVGTAAFGAWDRHRRAQSRAISISGTSYSDVTGKQALLRQANDAVAWLVRSSPGPVWRSVDTRRGLASSPVGRSRPGRPRWRPAGVAGLAGRGWRRCSRRRRNVREDRPSPRPADWRYRPRPTRAGRPGS